MRQFVVWSRTAVLIPLLAAFMACGGGSGTTIGPAASITVSPTTASLDTGQVMSISVTATDAKGNTVSSPGTITYASSNTAVATVSAAGAICAGTWDANNVVCTPGTTGTATITATSGSLAGTMTVFTHAHIDRLLVNPPSVNCKSQGQTVQMTAQALSNGTDITSTVGPITWTSATTAVATADTNGVVTAVAPGQSNITASVGSINSVPAAFVTCPVQSIHIHVSGAADTNFSIAPQGTQQLAADVLDTAGNPVTVSLAWVSSQPVVATVTSTGLATAVQPGTTSITATCSAGTCNIGQGAIYSNVVTGSVSGQSANVVFAAGTSSISLVPIDTTTNTAGTAITLPAQPNSLLVNPLGTSAFLGSSAGLMTLTTSNNAVTNDTAHPGTVLAISPDGTWVVVAGTSTVFLVNTTTSTSTQSLNITGATAAAFTPDAVRLFITAGTTLWFLAPGGGATSATEPAALTSATVLASGPFAYFGSGTANTVLAVTTCNSTNADTLVAPGPPTQVASLPNGSAVLAVDSPGIDVITPNSTLVGCPPPLTDTLVSKDFLQGTFTAHQLIVLPNSGKAYVTANLGKLLVYDVATGATSTIALGGTAASAFTGGATLDSKSVYIGGNDNAVHRIDVASGTDAQQIPVGFTPDLVAIRPK